jgi:hypothetical protein
VALDDSNFEDKMVANFVFIVVDGKLEGFLGVGKAD